MIHRNVKRTMSAHYVSVSLMTFSFVHPKNKFFIGSKAQHFSYASVAGKYRSIISTEFQKTSSVERISDFFSGKRKFFLLDESVRILLKKLQLFIISFRLHVLFPSIGHRFVHKFNRGVTATLSTSLYISVKQLTADARA